jgi:hypothetical protein
MNNTQFYTQNYQNLTHHMLSRYPSLAALPECCGFWERWKLLHKQHLYRLSQNTHTESEWAQVNTLFMHTRIGMVSALAQGVKHKKDKPLATVNELLKEHDTVFCEQLSNLLKHLHIELTHIQTYRRVSHAYARVYYQ